MRIKMNTKENHKMRICSRCLTPVEKSPITGYPFYCKKHDEDIYGIETIMEYSNPYKAKDEFQEKEMEEHLEFGESHGTPNQFFQNMYWDGLFVGREYSRNHGLDTETKFVISVPADVVKAEEHEKYGLKHNGEELEMYACLERVFYRLEEAIEFVKLILRDFPGCYGKAEDWDKI